MMNSSLSPSCDFRSITEASALSGYIHMPTFRIVWLLRKLSLGGKLRDDKNTAFV